MNSDQMNFMSQMIKGMDNQSLKQMFGSSMGMQLDDAQIDGIKSMMNKDSL